MLLVYFMLENLIEQPVSLLLDFWGDWQSSGVTDRPRVFHFELLSVRYLAIRLWIDASLSCRKHRHRSVPL